MYHEERRITLRSDMEYRQSLMVNLVDIGPMLLEHYCHAIVTPKHRIMEARKTLIILGHQPVHLLIDVKAFWILGDKIIKGL